MNLKNIYLLLAATLTATAVSAQTAKPTLRLFKDLYSKISDNGRYAVCEKASETDGTIEPAGGTILDLETMTERALPAPEGLAGVSDVTDDGQIAVGSYRTAPAFWSATEGWVSLPVPSGYTTGYLTAVTPDGKYAVGYVVPTGSSYDRAPVMYDLASRSMIDVPNLPKLDMQHENLNQMGFFGISPDGRYLLGQMSWSYVLPAHPCTFVYDRQTSTYKMIGFTENDKAPWTPDVPNTYFVEAASMSPNGLWVGGSVYMVEALAGSEYPTEYQAAFRYNVQTDEIEIYNKAGENDYFGMVILDDGTLLCGNPASNPYRFASVRSDGYHIPLQDIFKQVYDVDIMATLGVKNTGGPFSASADGKKILLNTDPNTSYLLVTPDPLADIAKKVNLLGNYTISPVSGSVMTSLKSFTITFDRDVEINGSSSAIKCLKEDGTDTGWAPVSSGGWVANGRKVTLTYRTRTLEAGVNYTITIPAGRIRLKGDNKKTSPEIKITFTGRGTDAVRLVSATPADGSAVAGLDLQSNPILLTFDANINLNESAKGQLWREGEDAPFCELQLASADRRLLVYPVNEQHLYSGTNYKVIIPAGTVTDISGSGANNEIVLNYTGSYVRQISADDKYLFRSTCDNYDDFIFYDGDQLAPYGAAQAWGFTKSVPWYIIRSSEETRDMALAAHSMFADEGMSDDWMSTPQLFIPDTECYMTFDAQSYLKNYNDVLRVYVYQSGNVYNTFTKAIVDDIRANGDLVVEKKLNPGADEQGLEGDWENIRVDLSKYAGKEVYIVFVNNNPGGPATSTKYGSAIFLDNIEVIHDLRFLTTFVTPTRVVNRENVQVRGSITVSAIDETLNGVTLTLRDSNGTELDKINDPSATLAKGQVYNFAFDTPVALNLGETTYYTVEYKLGEYTSAAQSYVRNLSFEPVKHVVIEEYSGRDCANCPLGILAIENLEKIYGNSIIPVVLRAYGGDPLGTNVNAYNDYLGLAALGAPSGSINRNYACFPMVSNGGDYMFSGAGLFNEAGQEQKVWLDYVRDEMAQPADAEITFSSAYDEASNKANVSFKVRSALNLTNTPMNIFAVLVEDDVDPVYQMNGFSSLTDPDLGQWANGGIYAQQYVFNYRFNDIARNSYGNTYNGSGNLVPSTMECGKEYGGTLALDLPNNVADVNKCKVILMLIDPGRGNIINANRAPINGSTPAGVGDIVADSSANVTVSVAGGDILVAADGEISATVYAVDGTMLGSAAGNGSVTVALNGYAGVVIVKAYTADGTTTAKLAVK